MLQTTYLNSESYTIFCKSEKKKHESTQRYISLNGASIDGLKLMIKFSHGGGVEVSMCRAISR